MVCVYVLWWTNDQSMVFPRLHPMHDGKGPSRPLWHHYGTYKIIDGWTTSSESSERNKKHNTTTTTTTTIIPLMDQSWCTTPIVFSYSVCRYEWHFGLGQIVLARQCLTVENKQWEQLTTLKTNHEHKTKRFTWHSHFLCLTLTPHNQCFCCFFLF